MKPPRTLSKIAKDYWKRNAPHAEHIGTLTPATADSFAELCRLYSEMAQLDTVNDPKGSGKYANLLKLFTQLTRYFGLCPSRPPERQQDFGSANPFEE
jgi:hypothetical protein